MLEGVTEEGGEKTMKIQRTGMFCLNSTIMRQAESNSEQVAGLTITEKDPGEAAIIMRVDNFVLSDEQAAKFKEIHERAAAELGAVLGW